MRRCTPLPEHEQVKPATPAMELNLVEMCTQGWWSCYHCHRPTRLVANRDPIENEEYEVCQHCDSKAVKWNPPVLTDQDPKRF